MRESHSSGRNKALFSPLVEDGEKAKTGQDVKNVTAKTRTSSIGMGEIHLIHSLSVALRAYLDQPRIRLRVPRRLSPPRKGPVARRRTTEARGHIAPHLSAFFLSIRAIRRSAVMRHPGRVCRRWRLLHSPWVDIMIEGLAT